jgi:ferric iron reductase protein FhuF
MTNPASPVAALAAVTEQVSYIRVSVRELTAASEEWMPGAGLVHDADVLYDTMRTTMDARGIDRDDIGMSLIVQGYAFRIASVAIGTWLVSGGCVDVSPDNVSIQFGRNRPNAVLLDEARWAVEPSLVGRPEAVSQLHEHLIDGHLAPMVDTARRRCRVGSRLLWSNIATSCASAFGAFMGVDLPEPRQRWIVIRDAANEFFAAARPELAVGGDVVPIGPIWAWQRNACCLYYQHTETSKCDDCSLFSDAERAARYSRILNDVTR